MFNKYRLPFALIIYAACFAVLYPLYQFRFDDDGIGYIMVTKRIASGDFFHGINGYWSPLHSWLIVPLYKAGLNEFTAFKLSNGLIGAGVLVYISRLCSKVNMLPVLHTISLFICIPIVLAYAFHDLAADILLCLLLLIYTDIISAKDFFENKWKILACAVIGCLSYFAKTYAFFFFLVHFTIIQVVHYKSSPLANRKLLLTRNLVMGISIFLLLCLPWIITLSFKYNFLTVGYSGKLNHAWALFPAKPKTDKLLGAPPAPLSCFWEDPFYTTRQVEPPPSVFTAYGLKQQAKLTARTGWAAVKCFFYISLFSFVIIPALVLYLRKKRSLPLTNMLLLILLFPLGYLLIHIELRFLYAVALLMLISGVVLLSSWLESIRARGFVRIICGVLYFTSFLIYPIQSMASLANIDAGLFTLAAELRQKGITGNYASDPGSYSEVQRLAYFTGSTSWSLSRLTYSYDELDQALRESGIDYYFYYWHTPGDVKTFTGSNIYRNAIKVIPTGRERLILLKLR